MAGAGGRWLGRLAALALGLIVALAAGEVVLRLSGKPRFYLPHSSPPQFATLGLEDDVLMYVNKRSSRIRFVYDGDVRGYFGEGCAVDHVTNSAGFRGPELREKAPGELSVAFLGDSFTFGEGVRFEDTTAEVARRLLAEAAGGRPVATLNFGVGGHDTIQAYFVLRQYALPLQPDVVVLGYVLNDAEAPILVYDEATESVRRRPIAVEQVTAAEPPKGGFYRLSLARLAWQLVHAREQTEHTIAGYRSLYAPDAEWWPRNRDSLQRIVTLCAERDVPVYVLGWPVLVRLDDYPFRGIHEAVGQIVTAAGATWIDLEPVFRGRDASSLWVHPTDHHPNEVAHELAARALVERLLADGVLER